MDKVIRRVTKGRRPGPKGFALLGMLALGACTLSPAQKAAGVTALQAAEAVGCQVDATVQPIAASVVAAAFAQLGVGVVALDDLLVHPLIVQACASVGGVPVATAVPVVTVTTTP